MQPQNYPENHCLYCASHAQKLWGKGLNHPVWKEMTGIDLYRCDECKSLSTFPMPTPEFLGECYSKYSFGGYPEHKAKAKAKSSQNIWYEHILDLFKVGEMKGERVADIGAGEGLLAESILRRSNGGIEKLTCVDYHALPESKRALAENGKLEWLQKDLSKEWDLKGRFDRIFCIAVLEHVIEPELLIRNLVESVKVGGKVHLLAPVADSTLFKFMGKKWPYHIPGEHLSIPSLEGVRKLCERAGAEIRVIKKSRITYSTNYILGSLFGFTLPSSFDLAWKLPIGIFSMTLEKKK